MDSESLHGLIEHEIAELRGAFPQLGACSAAVEPDGGDISVALDIRWPEHQLLVSGTLSSDPYVAVGDAFSHARRRLQSHFPGGRNG